jgi:hypothetical protein
VKEETKMLNNYLLSLENKVHKERNILKSKSENITAEVLRNKVPGLREEHRNLVEVFEYMNKQIKEKIGTYYAEGTHKR